MKAKLKEYILRRKSNIQSEVLEIQDYFEMIIKPNDIYEFVHKDIKIIVDLNYYYHNCKIYYKNKFMLQLSTDNKNRLHRLFTNYSVDASDGEYMLADILHSQGLDLNINHGNKLEGYLFSKSVCGYYADPFDVLICLKQKRKGYNFARINKRECLIYYDWKTGYDYLNKKIQAKYDYKEVPEDVVNELVAGLI